MFGCDGDYVGAATGPGFALSFGFLVPIFSMDNWNISDSWPKSQNAYEVTKQVGILILFWWGVSSPRNQFKIQPWLCRKAGCNGEGGARSPSKALIADTNYNSANQRRSMVIMRALLIFCFGTLWEQMVALFLGVRNSIKSTRPFFPIPCPFSKLTSIYFCEFSHV